MHHPVDYTHEEWASWFERARTHTRVTPGLSSDLRSSRGANRAALVAIAEVSLAELDDDVVVGEYLARFMPSSSASMAVNAIVSEMEQMAQDLLQAIIETRAGKQ